MRYHVSFPQEASSTIKIKSNLWSPTIHSFSYDVLCIIPGDVRNLSRVTRVSGFLTIFLVTYMLIFYAILAPS